MSDTLPSTPGSVLRYSVASTVCCLFSLMQLPWPLNGNNLQRRLTFTQRLICLMQSLTSRRIYLYIINIIRFKYMLGHKAKKCRDLYILYIPLKLFIKLALFVLGMS